MMFKRTLLSLTAVAGILAATSITADVRLPRLVSDGMVLQRDTEIRVFDLEQFLEIVGQAAEPLEERIWDPHVHVDGPFASLWAPYDFYVGGRFSHCGHAAFQYVLRHQTWWLVSETYTVRVDTCPTSP
jgi:hypothetical protein